MKTIIVTLIISVVLGGVGLVTVSTYDAFKAQAQIRKDYIEGVVKAKTDLDKRIAYERASSALKVSKPLLDIDFLKSKAFEKEPIDAACFWTAEEYRGSRLESPGKAIIFMGMWNQYCSASYGDNIDNYGLDDTGEPLNY